MNRDDFAISLEQGHLRSKKLLLKKADEYANEDIDNNRLIQFYKLGMISNVSPQMACISLAAKHFSSICDMAAKPENYTPVQWREKITDLRNYTHLLDALLEDGEALDE